MYKFITKNGRRIHIPASTMEHMEAHADTDCMVIKTKQIRFCPFCGRALKEETKL